MKKSIIILGSIALILSFVSCGTNPVLTARGTTAFLPEGNKFSGADVQFGAPLPTGYSKGHIDILLSAGYGVAELKDKTSSKNEIINKNLISFGAGANYFFNQGRLQPFIGAELFFLTSTAEKVEGASNDKSPYTILTPNAGLRFYLSNRFAITGSVGYQYHSTEFISDKPNTNNTKFNTSGIAPSFGLTYIFSK